MQATAPAAEKVFAAHSWHGVSPVGEQAVRFAKLPAAHVGATLQAEQGSAPEALHEFGPAGLV